MNSMVLLVSTWIGIALVGLSWVFTWPAWIGWVGFALLIFGAVIPWKRIMK